MEGESLGSLGSLGRVFEGALEGESEWVVEWVVELLVAKTQSLGESENGWEEKVAEMGKGKEKVAHGGASSTVESAVESGSAAGGGGAGSAAGGGGDGTGRRRVGERLGVEDGGVEKYVGTTLETHEAHYVLLHLAQTRDSVCRKVAACVPPATRLDMAGLDLCVRVRGTEDAEDLVLLARRASLLPHGVDPACAVGFASASFHAARSLAGGGSKGRALEVLDAWAHAVWERSISVQAVQEAAETMVCAQMAVVALWGVLVGDRALLGVVRDLISRAEEDGRERSEWDTSVMTCVDAAVAHTLGTRLVLGGGPATGVGWWAQAQGALAAREWKDAVAAYLEILADPADEAQRVAAAVSAGAAAIKAEMYETAAFALQVALDVLAARSGEVGLLDVVAVHNLLIVYALADPGSMDASWVSRQIQVVGLYASVARQALAQDGKSVLLKQLECEARYVKAVSGGVRPGGDAERGLESLVHHLQSVPLERREAEEGVEALGQLRPEGERLFGWSGIPPVSVLAGVVRLLKGDGSPEACEGLGVMGRIVSAFYGEDYGGVVRMCLDFLEARVDGMARPSRRGGGYLRRVAHGYLCLVAQGAGVEHLALRHGRETDVVDVGPVVRSAVVSEVGVEEEGVEEEGVEEPLVFDMDLAAIDFVDLVDLEQPAGVVSRTIPVDDDSSSDSDVPLPRLIPT